jgi:hypothetical protein
MTLARTTAAVTGALVAAGALAAGAGALAKPVRAPAGAAGETPLAKSPELWATVDVCNAPHHPDTIGVRGSMPGDGHARDTMYMRFLVQSLDAATKRWADIGKSADSGFVAIGSAAYTRQAGRTFELEPTPTSYTLRGEVEFQWRRAGRVVHLASVATSAGHQSLAGAEPKGYSAASCVLP